MPEESGAGEIDLSNLDTLLKDIEKDLPPEPAGSMAMQGGAAEMTDDIPELPPPVELDALKTVEVSAPPAPDPVTAPMPAPASAPVAISEPLSAQDREADNDSDVEDPASDELLAPPVKKVDSDESDDILEEMFTDEENETAAAIRPQIDEPKVDAEPAVSVKPVVAAVSHPVPEPSLEKVLAVEEPKTAPAEVADADMDFAAALETEEQERQAAGPAGDAPSLRGGATIPVVVGTTAMFAEALRARNYSYALQIGQSLRAKETAPAFRINLAGAMFLAGDHADAERELASILETHPYTVAARRNLEFVRAAKS